MFNNSNIDLYNFNEKIVIHSDIKFLKVKGHRYGGLYMYIPIEENKRKILDIINLATEFYHSKVDLIYLATLPYDSIKLKASKLYKEKGYVLWKDITGTCRFKELVTDCTRDNAIELILDYNMTDF